MTTFGFCITELGGVYRLRENDSPNTTDHDTFGDARQHPEKLHGGTLDWEYFEDLETGLKSWYAEFTQS